VRTAEDAGRTTLTRAGEWLLTSGIRDPTGRVARYYLSHDLRYAPISTEITGYAASALIYMYKESGDERYISAAKAAAFSLVQAWDARCHTMPFELGAGSRPYSYFFDTGIVVRGLLATWRACGAPELLSTAILCGESMARDFFDGQLFGPILALPKKSLSAYNPLQWSQGPGCYQLKAALGWYELWEIRKDQQTLELYRLMLRSCMANHVDFLPGTKDDQKVVDRLHAYLYFLEGLLPVVADEEYADAVRCGVESVSRYVEQFANQFVRADVLAQLLRMRIYADRYRVLPIDPESAEREASTLRSFESRDKDHRLAGGFWFGKRAGGIAPYINPWVTSFAVQALSMWDNPTGLRSDWRELI